MFIQSEIRAFLIQKMALIALLQKYLIPCVKIPDGLKYILYIFIYMFLQVISIDEVVTLQDSVCLIENYDVCFVHIFLYSKQQIKWQSRWLSNFDKPFSITMCYVPPYDIYFCGLGT